jgi:hypothetical protein
MASWMIFFYLVMDEQIMASSTSLKRPDFPVEVDKKDYLTMWFVLRKK